MKLAFWVLVAMLVLALVVVLVWLDRSDRQYNALHALYTEAVSKNAAASDDEQAVRDHRAVAEQYKAMFDELYDQAEHLAVNKQRSQDRDRETDGRGHTARREALGRGDRQEPDGS